MFISKINKQSLQYCLRYIFNNYV